MAKLLVWSFSVFLALACFSVGPNVTEGRPALAPTDVKLATGHLEDPNSFPVKVQGLEDEVTPSNFCTGYCGEGCPCKCLQNPCTCCSPSCCPSSN